MKINEIIFEDVFDDILEDEANDPVIFTLLDILEGLRNRSHDIHQIPKVRADALINLVKNQHPQFDLDTLMMAKAEREDIKNLIKDIKDDKSGVKYVYLQSFADDAPETADSDETVPKTAPEKTVDAMAKSALAKRG